MCTQSEDYRSLGPPVQNLTGHARIDQFLAERFPFKSRSEWKFLCSLGRVTVNGKSIRGSYRLRDGDNLAHFVPQSAEPTVDTNVKQIFVDSDILVVDKPANLPMHESGKYRHNTLVAILRSKFGNKWSPVHRLDRETSGLVLCASTQEVRRMLSIQFESRAISKTYFAILAGQCDWNEITVDSKLSTSRDNQIPHKILSSIGQKSYTRFVVKERTRHSTLVHAFPSTGRGNQIRIHAASVGHHIVGDKIYNANPGAYDFYCREGNSQNTQAAAGALRHALHAASLSFVHPVSQRFVTFSAEIPQDFADIWQQQLV